MKKTIVISAVNIRKGGTLTILRQCLSYLSTISDRYRIVALVHSEKLCAYEGIEYIEMPWCAKSWGLRLWAEYVTMRDISGKLAPVYLWFSLHDTTPAVKAERKAVYCQTAFPFLKSGFQDFRFDAKVVAFSLLTKFAYRINVHSNNWLVSQTCWFRKGLADMLSFPLGRIIVSRPDPGVGAAQTEASRTGGESIHDIQPSAIRGTGSKSIPDAEARTESSMGDSTETRLPYFIFPATPDCHKGFETLCEAACILEKKLGKNRFKLILTIRGDENRYAAWLKKNWGGVSSIEFRGFVKRGELDRLYRGAAALAFPSRIETWGLPISEFLPTGKPMILPDLPYAHETSGGAALARFVKPRSASAFAEAMCAVLESEMSGFGPVAPAEAAEPVASGWQELFSMLLN